MIYLASPYTHVDPLVRKTRFLLAEQVTAELLKRGEIVFSPIVHTHELSTKHALPYDFDFWQRYCLGMLRHAESFVILTISGWRESKGLQAELDFSRKAGIMVTFVDTDGRYIAEPQRG